MVIAIVPSRARRRPRYEATASAIWLGDARASCSGDAGGSTLNNMTRTRWPVSWSRMRYSPGEDSEESASFWMRALAATKLSTAPRQSMRPPGSILKISRGGVIGVHDLSGRHLCTNFVPGGLSCFGHLVSHTRADAACRAPTWTRYSAPYDLRGAALQELGGFGDFFGFGGLVLEEAEGGVALTEDARLH